MKEIKVALATEFLVQYGGAQKTLEAIAELFPEAPIFTAKYNPKLQSKFINNRKIICPNTKLTNSLSKHFFVFSMAPIFESFDFSDFDVIISDGTTWTKGIITKPNQLHLSYIHTPPRFLYGYSHEGTKWEKGVYKPFYGYLANMPRMWDYIAAQRPDYLMTNSQETKRRIKKFYGREAQVIYPPVEVEHAENSGNIPEGVSKEPYFLAISRLAAYKNIDLLVKTFNDFGKKLVIIGTGQEEQKLKSIAKENIQFLGCTSEEIKHTVLENCLGLINPVDDEDFGIVPIESMAHGKPVLAHKSGGHKETIHEGRNGMFFDELSKENLLAKLKEFEVKISVKQFNAEEIKAYAEKFSKKRFQEEFKEYVGEKVTEFFSAR